MLVRPERVRVTGPLEPFVDGFCAALAGWGYTERSAVVQVRLMAHLSRWLAGEGLDAGGLTGPVVERFLAGRRAGGHTRHFSVQGLARLLEYLPTVGVCFGSAPAVRTPFEEFLQRYRRYLVAERGLAAGTVRSYERVGRRFLSWWSSGGGGDLGRLAAADVVRFVSAELVRRPGMSVKGLHPGLRSVLRFLQVEGVTPLPLAEAVPAVAGWRGGWLPRGLTGEQVALLRAGCDRGGAVGRRDYAVITLLVRLGLRAGEVAGLQLGDVDWRAGEVTVRGKGRRRERLPLPADVGAAMADYLARGRPQTQTRALFVRARASLHGLTGVAVHGIVVRACARVGLPAAGPHRLRHTAATEMLRAGGSLPEIAQVLRHRSPASTAAYAKVDHAALRMLSKPWPGTPA